MTKLPITVRYMVGKQVETVSGELVWKHNLLLAGSLCVRSGDEYVFIVGETVIDARVPADKLPSAFLQNLDELLSDLKFQGRQSKAQRVQMLAMEAEAKANQQQAEKQARAEAKLKRS